MRWLDQIRARSLASILRTCHLAVVFAADSLPHEASSRQRRRGCPLSKCRILRALRAVDDGELDAVLPSGMMGP